MRTMVVVLAMAVACGGSEAPPVAAVPSAVPEAVPMVAEPSRAPPEAPPAKPTKEGTLTGTLHFTEAPQTMSVEAYLHSDFTLDVGGATENLSSSDAVAYDALKAFDGKKVEIQGAWYEPAAPNPMEAAPMGMDGQPMPRPGYWAVLAIKEAP